MLIIIDNYDSFTYNLVQYFGELGADVEVHRNDKITIEILKEAPRKVHSVIAHHINNKILRSKQILESWMKTTTILLLKKATKTTLETIYQYV